VTELCTYLIDAVEAAGYRVRTPREPERRGGLVAFEVPDAQRVLHELLARKIIVDERHGALRASPHFFTTQDDLDSLVAAVREVCPPR
jgi:selenocysteine lyase/cysteine desulfurase